MLSATRTWALFKLIRIFIFSLSTILCIAWTALYTVLLIHGWALFMNGQRALVLVLISIYGISSIMTYLMIVVHFRPWMDGARVAIFLFFQAGGTVTFFFFRHSLPCSNTGPLADSDSCKTMEDIVIFGGWSLCGLLLIYVFILAIMFYVPVPPPPPDPEATLMVSVGNEKEKRQSIISVVSHYSQASFIEPDLNREPPIANSLRMGPNYYRPGTPSSVRFITPSTLYLVDGTGAPPVTEPSKIPVGDNYGYRPGTPGSVSVRSTISRSSTQGLTNPRYDYMHPRPAPTPPPMVTDSLNDQQHPRSLTPGPSITTGVQTSRLSTSLESLTYGRNVATPPPVQPFSSTVPLRSAPPTSRGRGPVSNRNGLGPSVPRSPSPENLSFNAPVTATPMSAMLATHPALPTMSPYHGSHGVYQVRRQGSPSVPIRVNDAPTYANSPYRTAGGYPVGGYPAGGYPAGGYPAGGYPAGGYPASGYPPGGYARARASDNNLAVRGKNEQDANSPERWWRDLIYNPTI